MLEGMLSIVGTDGKLFIRLDKVDAMLQLKDCVKVYFGGHSIALGDVQDDAIEAWTQYVKGTQTKATE